jgi:hypothetical protein
MKQVKEALKESFLYVEDMGGIFPHFHWVHGRKMGEVASSPRPQNSKVAEERKHSENTL